jgi:hypothetical protein
MSEEKVCFFIMLITAVLSIISITIFEVHHCGYREGIRKEQIKVHRCIVSKPPECYESTVRSEGNGSCFCTTRSGRLRFEMEE